MNWLYKDFVLEYVCAIDVESIKMRSTQQTHTHNNSRQIAADRATGERTATPRGPNQSVYITTITHATQSEKSRDFLPTSSFGVLLYILPLCAMCREIYTLERVSIECTYISQMFYVVYYFINSDTTILLHISKISSIKCGVKYFFGKISLDAKAGKCSLIDVQIYM